MTIDYTSKAKLEGLGYLMPQIFSQSIVAPPEAKYVLLSDDKALSTYFVGAIVLYDQILWISDKDYTDKIQKFISETN